MKAKKIIAIAVVLVVAGGVVWLFTGKWEKFDRVFAFLLSFFVTPIIGIPLTKFIFSNFWND